MMSVRIVHLLQRERVAKARARKATAGTMAEVVTKLAKISRSSSGKHRKPPNI